MYSVDVNEHMNYAHKSPHLTIPSPPASNLQRMHPVIQTFEPVFIQVMEPRNVIGGYRHFPSNVLRRLVTQAHNALPNHS